MSIADRCPGADELTRPHLDRDEWRPVMYYPDDRVGDGPVQHRVESYPHLVVSDDRFEASVWLRFAAVAVAVVTRSAAPVRSGPGCHLVVPATATKADVAYEVRVTTHDDLREQWAQACAVAVALNGAGSLTGGDLEVLAAAEAGRLLADSRFTGTINEMRWTGCDGELGGGRRVPVRQARRLRDDLGLIADSDVVRHCAPHRPELSTSGAAWAVITMKLTAAGAAVLDAARAGGVAHHPTTTNGASC